MELHHLNCGVLHASPNPPASCHCLLLELADDVALIDTGIGLLDIARPVERIGASIIEAAGFQFRESDTAALQLEHLGFRVGDVRHIVLTHGDPDHAGGLADFPEASVHVSEEELAGIRSGLGRYCLRQFEHEPKWVSHTTSPVQWFGLPARPIDFGSGVDVLMIPLFGHTSGHCGVAIRQKDRWLLHVGDAYYLRVELERDDHPVSALAAARADDDPLRRESLGHLRRLARDHPAEVEMLGYHDFTEFPA